MTLLHSRSVRADLRAMLSTVILESPVLIGRSLRRNGTTVRSHLADDVQYGRTLCGLRLQELGADVRAIAPVRTEFEDHAFDVQCGMCVKRFTEAVRYWTARTNAQDEPDVLVVTRRLSPQEPGLYVEEASDLRIQPGTAFPRVIRIDTGERVIDLIRVDRERAADAADGLLGWRRDRDGDLIVQDYQTVSGADTLRLYND